MSLRRSLPSLLLLSSVLPWAHSQLQEPAELPVCVPTMTAVNNYQTQVNCPAFGNLPAPLVNCIESPDGCQDIPSNGCGGKMLFWTDPNGTPRQACYVQNTNASPSNQLPLIVWLHPSLIDANNSFPDTQWAPTLNATENINGKPGFSYLLVEGRNTYHKYPIPDNVGVGWDNWYRDFTQNVDALTIDHFTSVVLKSGVHDSRNVHLSGWSNGAQFALIYALDRNYYASAAVYSAPDPYRDCQCSEYCPQQPQPLYFTPLLDVHNHCDIIGTCTTGLYFYSDLHTRYPQLDQHITVIDGPTQAVVGEDSTATCDALCSSRCGETLGTLYHGRWPTMQNQLFFDFMRAHPLPAGGQIKNPDSNQYPLGVSQEPYKSPDIFQCAVDGAL